MDYFTSDLHYRHEKMVAIRGFSSVDEMDEKVTESINNTVTEADNLYIIGDTVWKQNDPLFKKLFSSIKAKKILIQGNHDLIGKRGHLSWIDLLDEFHPSLIRTFDTEAGKQVVHMYHYPIGHWYQQHRGTWHLHGHLHGSDSMIPGKILDVGWDVWRKPISINEIKSIMDTKPIRANHHHEKWLKDDD